MRKFIKIILCLLFSSSLGTCLEPGSLCKTKNEEDGVCKNYKECQLIVHQLRIRKIGMGDIVKCNNFGVICCPIEPVGEISKRKCKEIEKFTQTKIRVGVSILNPNGSFVTVSNCKHESVPLIVGGQEANRYEFPHQAHLGYETRNGIEWACGGSLISNNFVLTAAHCNGHKGHGSIKFVKLGMIDRQQDDSEISIYKVAEVIINSQFNRKTFNHDIALLRLDRNVVFSPDIYPICLPTTQHDEGKVLVTGLGKTGKKDSQSDKLLKVVLEKFSHAECQEKLRVKEIDKATMLCFGDQSAKKDACGGDSGGPAQISNDNESHCTYKIIGVVSFGAADCGTPGIPGVFVNVYNYLSWIEKTVWGGQE